MLKSLLLTALTVLVLFTAGFAQTNAGAISGRINSVDDQPLEGVSISLIELNKNTLTDTKGNYVFTGLTPGKYTSENAWSVRLSPQAPARFTGGMTLKF